ncbi:preprotein translocase subunit YajC [Herbiconiux sp. KACC 21604]|uniref:preprotein translocase subunit YajC n=1 Tax=unclassified Herbiconiux TaxID=2618217 RepID=UPI001491DAD6|nr:preprotein translocase subunit YajC [Herbiconiux sp. SALV-R1]QJU53629.1 preprotein translocase subunit YajC [Herbiconiux sp. SALV-R1]WPO88613.1 preprotein translocase subunit YajC [Herbiconiux sp. KACC 21604]
MAFDPLTIIMLVVLAVLVFFMFRNSRKRKAQAEELQSKVMVGAEVMTNFGLFGTILEMDDEENQVLLETTPGTVLKVHRQTVTRVVTDSPLAPTTTEVDHTNDGEPEYGERIDEPATTTADESTATPDVSAEKSDKKGDE